MKTMILACQTLEDELLYTMKQSNINYEIMWIESSLHNVPQKLHSQMQECIQEIAKNKSCDRLLVAMGKCGNAIDKIVNGPFEMIIPKVDDCISLLFGSDEKRNNYTNEHSAYYLTQGWMRGKCNILAEYEYSIKKYGQETADVIAEMMYGHYKQLALLDNGINSIDTLYRMTEPIEKNLNLKRCVVPVTVNYLVRLLNGPWDQEHFFKIAPNDTLYIN